jgi:large subunit ribosomal protein L32
LKIDYFGVKFYLKSHLSIKLNLLELTYKHTIMPIPKRRTTRSSRGQRRSHDALKKLTLTTCPKCSESIMPHRVCKNCGTYAGKQVLDVKSKENKKNRKDNEKKVPQK